MKSLVGIGLVVCLLASCGEEKAKESEAQEALEQMKEKNLEVLESFDGSNGRPSGILPPKD